MIYAPVRITTLNRYEHFKRCLESLEDNTWARYTEVFVSVDYPVAERHWEGYKKIREYLEEKENNNTFAKLNVFVQEKNLGPGGNSGFLENIIFEKYDREIALEDDIETAPNFLEYMDKALEWGADNDRVYGVCAYYQPKKKSVLYSAVKEYNMFLRTAYNPWGVGLFREKKRKLKETVSKEWLDSISKNNQEMLQLFQYRKYTFWMFSVGYLTKKLPVFFNKQGEVRCIDIIVEIYMSLNGMYAIFPVVSKTRNWGFDGSGENCARQKGDTQKYQLDDRMSFEIADDDPVLIDETIMKKISWGGLPNKLELYRAVVYYFLYRIKVLFKR